MKHEIYETENTVVYCSVLEDADLKAMTDDELREELEVWQRTAARSDDYDVIDNVRLIHKHIRLRAMITDEEEEADVILLANGVFLFPNRVPADMPHSERSKEEMRLWWGRPYITEVKGAEELYVVECLDGGAWDRPTFKGQAATVKEAIAIANRLLA